MNNMGSAYKPTQSKKQEITLAEVLELELTKEEILEVLPKAIEKIKRIIVLNGYKGEKQKKLRCLAEIMLDMIISNRLDGIL